MTSRLDLTILTKAEVILIELYILPVFFAGLPLKDPNDEGAPTDSHSGISKKIKIQELDIKL